MSKREIHGFTVCLNGEHEDKEGYTRCNDCDSKTILVSAHDLWAADEEPYKNGEKVELDMSDLYVGEVTGHWCPKCLILTSLSYNFA